jgi:hypothetical protein
MVEANRLETLAHWIVKSGIRKAASSTAFLMAWAWVQSERDKPMTAHGFCDAYGISLATYYRKLYVFREVFPAFKDPGVLLATAEAQLGDGLRWGELPHDAEPVAA